MSDDSVGAEQGPDHLCTQSFLCGFPKFHSNVSVEGPSRYPEVIGASLHLVDSGTLDHLDKYGYLWRLNR